MTIINNFRHLFALAISSIFILVPKLFAHQSMTQEQADALLIAASTVLLLESEQNAINKLEGECSDKLNGTKIKFKDHLSIQTTIKKYIHTLILKGADIIDYIVVKSKGNTSQDDKLSETIIRLREEFLLTLERYVNITPKGRKEFLRQKK